MSDFPEDSYEEEEDGYYTPRVMSPGATLIVEMQDETYIFGAMIHPTTAGVIIGQTHLPMSPSQVNTPSDLSDLMLSTPVETFIPYTSIHYIQSLSDLSMETVISDFSRDLNNYGKEEEKEKEKEDPPSSETPDRKSLWDRFLIGVNRLLESVGL